jgi:hypothetical protein
MTTLLSEALLEEFAARLRAQRAPAWDAAQPGLSDSEMERLVRPIGLRLPFEARLWWGCAMAYRAPLTPGSTKLGRCGIGWRSRLLSPNVLGFDR